MTLLVLGAALLAWGVLSKTFLVYLAAVAPGAALHFDRHQPTALVELADAAVAEQVSATKQGGRLNQSFSAFGASQNHAAPAIAKENEPVLDWIQSALRRDPINATALRILGQLAESQGDEERTRRSMQAAAQMSLRESVAVDWLMRKNMEKADYATSLYYADALLQTRPGMMEYVIPTLLRIAEDKSGNELLKALLANNPPWRVRFFSNLPNYVSDARTPLALLLALRDSPAPPTSADLRAYLDFLIAHKFYQLAYSCWLQFLSPERLSSAGLLYNGNFEIAPSGLPFDWVLTQGNGVTVDIVHGPDGEGRALLVAFADGRVEFQSVKQLVVLTPGKYRFSGKYKGELSGLRGMKWRITCANGTPIAESAMMTGVRPQWQQVDVPFTVPLSDCGAQYVRLDLDSRMASEQFVTGAFWFDDFAIARDSNKP